MSVHAGYSNFAGKLGNLPHTVICECIRRKIGIVKPIASSDAPCFCIMITMRPKEWYNNHRGQRLI